MSAEVIIKVYIQDIEDRANIVSYGPKSSEQKNLIKTETWTNSNDTCTWVVSVLAIPDVSYKRIDNHGELWLAGFCIGRFKLKP